MKPKHKPPSWLRRPSQPSMQVGVAWYTEKEWALVKANSADPERFEATFSEWTEVAQAAVKQLLEAGVKTEPFYIKSEELLAWCTARNKPNNSASRAEYVSEALGAQANASGA